MTLYTSVELPDDESDVKASSPKWLQNILDEPELHQEVSSVLDNIFSRKKTLELLRINTSKRVSKSGKTIWTDESYNYADLPSDFQKKVRKLMPNETDMKPESQIPKPIVTSWQNKHLFITCCLTRTTKIT